MSSERFEAYRRRFLEGELSASEEIEFRRMVSVSDREEDAVLQHYFDGVEKAGMSDFTPIRKEAFFQDVADQSRSRRRWLVRAAAVGIIGMMGAGFYGLHLRNERQAARESVDRSVETTRRALTAISTRINASVEDVSRAMDFSGPMDVFSKVNDQLKTAEDANNEEIEQP